MVDLSNCDREPIHIPGLIQPHGVLLVLQEPTLKIVQVSNNTFEAIGYHSKELLGKSLANLLDNEQISAIKQCLAEDFENVNPLTISIARQDKTLDFDAIVHRSDGAVILELELNKTKETTNFFQFYQRIKGAIAKLQKAPTRQEMCQEAVKEVRKLTGFDRVMVYQFNAEGAGSIVAEDKTAPGTPYLGLHYPPTDVPVQAKKLYTLNWLRLIPDVNYQPVALTPPENPLTDEPLDLSLAVLRSVSPLHIEYLNNMGVTASMSISLVQNQKLWGLIACHHSSPKYVPYGIRTACEFIGQVMSLELATKEANEDLDYKMRIKSLQARFVERLSGSDMILDGLMQLDANVLDLVSASGAVVCTEGHCIHIGKTPSPSDISALLDWLKTRIEDNLFHTHSLPKLYPEAESFKDVASGLLALEISPTCQNYILWFRPEVIQTVNWSGNPNKPVEVLEDGSLRLFPRKSFDLWKETVRGCSLPWKACEIEAVAELRSLIVGIILRQAEELAKINVELERSNIELDSFAYIASHDLKEPLRGIHNYANFLIEDYAQVLDRDGVAKLQTLARLTQRMEDLINALLHFSRLGRAELEKVPTDLNKLVQQAIETVKMSREQNSVEFRLPKPLPIIECDRIQTNELLTNLLANAIKYNDKAQKWVEIGVLVEQDKPETVPVFYVKDNGIGIAERHKDKIFQIFRRLHGQNDYGGGTGAGLTISRKIVERHGGKIWVNSIPKEGSTFYFTLTEEIK
jgi:light-regulated signal transduction histidine kinase (bacteriophytochrome)